MILVLLIRKPLFPFQNLSFDCDVEEQASKEIKPCQIPFVYDGTTYKNCTDHLVSSVEPLSSGMFGHSIFSIIAGFSTIAQVHCF